MSDKVDRQAGLESFMDCDPLEALPLVPVYTRAELRRAWRRFRRDGATPPGPCMLCDYIDAERKGDRED